VVNPELARKKNALRYDSEMGHIRACTGRNWQCCRHS